MHMRYILRSVHVHSNNDDVKTGSHFEGLAAFEAVQSMNRSLNQKELGFDSTEVDLSYKMVGMTRRIWTWKYPDSRHQKTLWEPLRTKPQNM